MSERKLELRVLTDSVLISRLQNVERFSALTITLARINVLIGSALIVLHPDHLASATLVGATTLAYILQDGKNHRIKTDLRKELKIREAGDFTPLLYPEVLQ